MDKQLPPAHAFDAPQVARLAVRGFEAEVRVTPLGLLSIGALVAGILLSVPPIIRAGAAAARARRALVPPPSS